MTTTTLEVPRLAGAELTPLQFAKRSGKDRQTIYRWIRKGKIKARRFGGGGWLIPESELAPEARDTPPALHTLKNFCRMTSISSVELYEYLAAGFIRTQTVNGRLRIPESEVARVTSDRALEKVELTGIVPILGSVSAGAPIAEQEDIVGWIPLPANNKADFAVYVSGESMAPDMTDGDLVGAIDIRGKKSPKRDKVVIALVDGEQTLKRYRAERGLHGRKWLEPANPRFDCIELSEADVLFLGEVVWTLKFNP